MENILDAGVGGLDEPGHGPLLGGVRHRHHVVGDAVHFLRGGGGGADGHPPVDLHGVHADHLAVIPLGQQYAHFGFAAGGGAHHAEHGIFIIIFPFHRGLLSFLSAQSPGRAGLIFLLTRIYFFCRRPTVY